MKDQVETIMIKRGILEWNLNTILQLVSIGSTLILLGIAFQSLRGNIVAINTRITNQEIQVKDRIVQIKETENVLKEQVRVLELDSRKQSTAIENMALRQTMTEQNQSAMLQTMKEIQTSFSEYSSEQKVQREILQRIEASLKSNK